MDRPEQERQPEHARIVLTPDRRPAAPGEPLDVARKPHRQSAWSLLLGALGLIAGLAGIGAAAWIQAESRTEIRRLASDIAQLRVSLDLYARNAGADVGNSAAMDSDALAELGNRLAILERNWRDAPQPQPAAAATAPPVPAANEDCLPSGMRILVAEGDSYPVCGQPVAVNVGQVANGYIVLIDGTTIASGGAMPLPGSPCTIGVTSGGDEGLTGYAEIRVTC